MLDVRKHTMTLYVDRAIGQWIVRDLDGRFWSLPYTENPWEERQPYTPAEETELELVPGHYKDLLGIPSMQRTSDP